MHFTCSIKIKPETTVPIFVNQIVKLWIPRDYADRPLAMRFRSTEKTKLLRN